MTITITPRELLSRVARSAIGGEGDDEGVRTINIFQSLTNNETEEQQGLFRWVVGLVARLGNFLLRVAARAVGWLLRNIWEILVTATLEIINFDWNQTDQALQSQIQANNIAIAGALGDLAGTGSVWIASVVIAGAVSLKFPVLAGKVALALAEEGGDEIRGQLNSFLYTVRDSVTRNLILSSLLTARRLRIFGLVPITDQRQPWTIAGEIEERIERIDNPYLRAFTENFVESAGEAIIEAGYVVSYAIDDYYRAAKLANQSQFGTVRTVVIKPDRNLDGEKITLSGEERLVKQSIQQAIAVHRFVHNRDLGTLVGQPAEDWLRAGLQRRKLTVVFKSKQQPPWTPATGNERVREVSYTIPDADLGLTWEKIKTAARVFTWGKFRATANLDNGRQIAVYGATPAEAEDKLKELLTLSTARLLTMAVSEEKDRHPNLRKEPRRMYPAYATLLIRRSTAEATGTNDLSGNNFRQEHVRIDLWPDTQPPDLLPLP